VAALRSPRARWISPRLISRAAWLSCCVANSYYERFHDASMWAPKPPATVPTGVAVFAAGDYAIRRFAEKSHNITHWSEFYRGGHFPALETPDLLAGDIHEFFGSLAK
jgi:epoxide hydrolase